MKKLVKKIAVISLGGSIVTPGPCQINKKFLKAFRQTILDCLEKGWRFVITVGGGKTSQVYNESAKRIVKVKNKDLDWLGIATTKLNVELLRVIFADNAYEKVVANPKIKLKTSKPIIIASGWLPGCSTDKDAVLWAENVKAEMVINLSNIDYVYNKDPNKFSQAKPFKKLSWNEYRDLIGGRWEPRMNVSFDPVAAKIAQKIGLKVVIMNGLRLTNFKNFLAGKKFIGTTIG
ncbi:MAG: UMP kinase [Patescibacteria group bacterium]